MSSQALRTDFHSEMASTILNEIQYLKSQYYYFLGKVDSWGGSDLSPETVQVDSLQENLQIRSNALYFKQIKSFDVSLVCNRYDWVSGLVYSQWDHTKDMTAENFYVLTDDNNVYKCLDNSAAAASTVKPTGKSYSPFRTIDGYLWKYMYTVPAFKRSNFTSLKFIPVQTSLSDSFYNKGSIEQVVVTEPGYGYTDAQLTTITVTGTTTGSGASATVSVNPISGTITSITLVSGGSGYTKGVNLSVTSGSGSGAVLTATVSGGVVTGITIVDGGFNYVNGNGVNFSVGGAILLPVVSRTSGTILDVKIINPGIGYTTAPTLAVVGAGGAGSGLYTGNATALLESVVDAGSIKRVLIRDPGKDYPADSATTITAVGDGSDAAFSPVIYNGSLVDVVVENSGAGYTYIKLQVVGDGTGATVNAVISTSDFTSEQSIIEQTTIPGGIHAVNVTQTGQQYSPTTTITISGDGTGCIAVPTIVNGSITKITVTEPGVGYTYADVVINDPNRYLIPDSIPKVICYAILPPKGGHGKDAVAELYGHTLAIASLLRNEELLNSLNIEQEYRQFGIIKNPAYVYSGKAFKKSYDLVTYDIQVVSTSGLVEDELLVSNGIKYRVVSWDQVTGVVNLQKLGYTNQNISTLVAESDPLRTYNVLNITKTPSVDKYSGKLLYISNETPFYLTDEQGIVVKTFIKF